MMFDFLKKLLSSESLDTAQAAADVGGVFDQSGVTDLTNAGVSLFRGLTSGNSKDRWRHFSDSGIRAVSAIPLLGDFAKLGRTGRYVEEGSRIVGGAHRQNSLLNLLGGNRQGSASQQKVGGNGGLFSWLSGRDDSDLTGREAYFRGSADYRKQERLRSGSPFYNKTEAWDERFRSMGVETEAAMGRRKERQFRERVHQQFLADPSADVSQSTARVKSAKSEFDSERQSLLEERATEERAKVVDGMKSFTTSIKGAVTAILTLPPAISKFGEMLVEAKRATGIYSGGTVARLAQGDLQRMQMNMRTGRNTAASTNAMLDEMAKFRESYQPLRENWANIATTLSRASIFVGRMAADITSLALNVSQIQAVLDWFYKEETGNKAKGGSETRTQAFARSLINPENNKKGARQPLPPL